MATLKLFAALREAAGIPEARIEAGTVQELIEKASAIYGDDFSSQTIHATVAVNGVEVAREDCALTKIAHADEVALLPPVSGGSERSAEQQDGGSGAALAWTAALAGAIVVASSISTGALAGLIAFVAAGVTFASTSRLAASPPPVVSGAAAVGAGSFPLWLWAEGEPGLMWAGTTAVLLVSSAMMFGGRPAGATGMAAAVMLLAFYIGFGLSYAVLIVQHEPGPQLLLSAGLILVAFRASTAFAARTTLPQRPHGTGRGEIGATPTALAGLVAAEVAAMISLLFLEEPFSAGPLAILGLVIAASARLGEVSGRMLGAGLSKGTAAFPPPAGLDSWLVALPAFFYGFRLYLT